MTQHYQFNRYRYYKKESCILVLVLSCLCQPIWAQSGSGFPNFPWATTLPAEPLAIAADGPRGAYVLLKGNTLLQLDTKGRERWRQTLTGWPTVQRIATDGAGRLIVAGAFTGQFTIADSTYKLEQDLHRSTFIAQFDSTHARRWVTYVLARAGRIGQPTSAAI